MNIKTHLLTALAALALAPALGRATETGVTLPGAVEEGSRTSFNSGWSFAHFDQPSDEPKALEAVGSDTSSWQRVALPHDWGIGGPFQIDLPGNTGKLPCFGIGWYRKEFTVPKTDKGKRIFLDVDGAMSDSTVYLNGEKIGGWPYGYSSWRVELTEKLKFGAKNTLAVRLDNKPESSRWYPGGGIYRNTWLVTLDPVHIGHWGVQVTTPEISKEQASVRVTVTVDNQRPTTADATVSADIWRLGAHPIKVATCTSGKVTVVSDSNAVCTLDATVNNPDLWDLNSPSLYCVVTSVGTDGKVTDTQSTTFGIRTVVFDASKGLLLNGRKVALKGVCNHHDLGALGAAVNTRALERQLQLLKEMGCNSIRTSHNPPAPELLDLCDSMGILVMDEAFDCWLKGKNSQDYSRFFPEWHDRDITALVRRDRNHPSVFLWSAGNEIWEQRAGEEGERVLKDLVSIFHREDPTRPVTAACNNAQVIHNGFYKGLDVLGLNYKPHQYAEFHGKEPQVPVFGSETASCVSSRGEYFFPVSDDKSQGFYDFQVSSYDLYAPPWAMPPDKEFAAQDANLFVMGEYVWTGFDYLGEPTPYNKDRTNLLNFQDEASRKAAEAELNALGKIKSPSRSSYFGILDLCGFKKDRYFLYQAKWRPELPMIHILPHWNWPERVGQVTPVHVYTSGDEAELFLNGTSLGRKKKGPSEYRLRWDDVVYAPGILKAVAYKDGKPWANETIKTTGPATRLSLTPDRASIAADGKDLSFVTVAVEDKEGLMVPRSKNPVTFSIKGPGEIVALDNGDAASLEPFKGTSMKAFNGLCLAIVKATGPGPITLEANADGLTPAKIKLQAK